MPKKFRDKMKHSANSFRRNAPKEGRGGKGTWGNPMDDVKFVEKPPQAALDENDPNFDDNDEQAIDEWEEAVWLAEHEEYDDYFEEFDDARPMTVTDLAINLENVITEALKSVVLGEKDANEVYYDIIPAGGTLESGGGTVICKRVLSMVAMNDEHDEVLAQTLEIFQNSLNIISIRDIDHGFIEALASPNKDVAIRLRDFALILQEKGLYSEEKIGSLAAFAELEDPSQFLKDLKSNIKLFINEYFTSQDIDEAIRCTHDLQFRFYQYEVVKVLVNMSMDKDDKSRELASQLLGCCDAFDTLAVRRGLEILLERLDDLNKDVPDATGMLACFIARCISDEAIPPRYISEVSVQISCATTTAIHCLQKVQHLLNMRQSAQRLARVWGPGRGRPLSEIKQSMSGMLSEYISNTDLNELARSLVELAEPNFHHEFVKQSIIKASDSGAEAVATVQTMLEMLLEKNIVDPYQVVLGFRRLYTNLDNYKIDSPNLPSVFHSTKELMEPLLGDMVVHITSNSQAEI